MGKIPGNCSAHPPAPDWSQARATVPMLELAALQIEAAMTDSNAAVDVLARSFTAMADDMKRIAQTVGALPDDAPTGAAKRQLAAVAQHMAGEVRQAIIAFQFYDKLAQRLSRVGLSLGELGRLVGDGSRGSCPDEWRALHERIKARYGTAEEIALFAALMAGVPATTAIAESRAGRPAGNDDIELF